MRMRTLATWIGLRAVLGCCLSGACAGTLHAASPIHIEVQEPAGIRRFQYPVAVELTFSEAVARELPFRLLYRGKPVLAQLSPAETGAAVARWWLDFPADLLPYQSAEYELQSGRDVPPGKTSPQGLRLVRSADEFRIVNDPHIAWTVPGDAGGGLLRSVRSGELEYVGSVASGLGLHDRHGQRHALGGSDSRPAVSVLREGPLAVSLRFEFDEILPQVRGVLDLTFPVFKSWVEADWRIDDPRGEVTEAEVGLQVNLDPPTRQAPTLVDFGTSGLVYLALGPGQEGLLHSGAGPWEVLRGPPGRWEPFVTGPSQSGPHAAPEGWAHVMDRRRCLAVAVQHFGSEADDRLAVAAEGRVALRRSFPPARPATAKRLHFWLHFVPFPPQETAATSPQAMQHPVVVRAGSLAK